MTPNQSVTKVWRVEEGPFSVEDLPESEEVPEGFDCWLVCMVTEGDSEEITYDEMWFTSFEDAYQFKVISDTSMEPLEINDG